MSNLELAVLALAIGCILFGAGAAVGLTVYLIIGILAAVLVLVPFASRR